MKLTVNIYDERGRNIVRTANAEMYDLSMGTIRRLMKLLKIEDTKNTVQVLKALTGAWDELIVVLGYIFPDVTDEEWDTVKVKEIVPLVVNIAKYAVSDALTIPSDSKN